MHRRFLVALLAFCLLGAGLAAGPAGASRFYTPDYGSKTPEEIGGFDLGADGSLTPLPGAPFPAAQPGFGGLFDLAFNPDGTRAITGYFFTGGVQSFRGPASGIFELAPAVPSASTTAVAISPDGRFAYGPTRDFGGMMAEGIRIYAFNPDGSLTPQSSGGSGEYEDVALTPDGRFLFATAGNNIERFAVAADGSLSFLGTTPAPGSYLLSMAPDGRFLFALVSGGSAGGFTSFAVGADGGLQQAGDTALVADSFPRLYAMAPDGRHLYLADPNGAGAIHTFAIAADGAPSVVGSMPVEEPESAGVSPDGRFLVYYRGGGSDNALGVASIGADGVPVLLNREVPWTTGEPEPIVFQPQPTPVAAFKVKPGAPGQASRFDATGSARAARYDWDFGDGTTLANGGPTPSHIYAKAGAYPVTLTVTDASGCSVTQIYNGQSTICPGGTSPRATAAADTLPVLGKVKAKPKKFKAKPKGKAKGKFGTTFRYTVNESAKVSFKFERKVRRPIKRCSRAKVCPRFRFKTVGSRRQAAKVGVNKLKWNGRLKGKPLSPGSYRATVTATDKAGGRSASKTVGFRILPPQEP